MDARCLNLPQVLVEHCSAAHGFFACSTKLEELRLKSLFRWNVVPTVAPHTWAELSRLPRLQKLSFKHAQRQLTQLDRLTSLDLDGFQRVSGENLALLSRLSALQELNLTDFIELDYNLSFVSSLTSLRGLTILTWFELTEADVGQWTRLSSLESLCLDGGESITECAMAAIARISGLRNLSICEVRLNYDVARHLTALTALSRLEMIDTGVESYVRPLFDGIPGLELEMEDDSDEEYDPYYDEYDYVHGSYYGYPD